MSPTDLLAGFLPVKVLVVLSFPQVVHFHYVIYESIFLGLLAFGLCGSDVIWKKLLEMKVFLHLITSDIFMRETSRQM